MPREGGYGVSRQPSTRVLSGKICLELVGLRARGEAQPSPLPWVANCQLPAASLAWVVPSLFHTAHVVLQKVVLQRRMAKALHVLSLKRRRQHPVWAAGGK
jgi:hypothetical protein